MCRVPAVLMSMGSLSNIAEHSGDADLYGLTMSWMWGRHKPFAALKASSSSVLNWIPVGNAAAILMCCRDRSAELVFRGYYG